MDFPYKLLRCIPASSSLRSSTNQFQSLQDFLSLAASKDMVWFGEFHSEDRITSLIEQVVKAMGPDRSKYTEGSCKGRLHIVCEHFSFEMQDMIERYQMEKTLDFNGFTAEYKEIGTEGHKLDPYKGLLEYCRRHSDDVALHGGFIPRPCAGAYMRAENASDKVNLYRKLSEEHDYLPDLPTLRDIDRVLGLDGDRLPSSLTDRPVELYGSPGHFNIFESLMSGRDIYEKEEKERPNYQRYSKIFQAQLIKDWAMAWKIHGIAEAQFEEGDRFLVLAGKAHLSHYHGVPEVLRWIQRVMPESKLAAMLGEDHANELLVCAQMMYEIDLNEHEQKENDEECEKIILENELIQKSMFLSGERGNFDHPVADVLYIYDEEDWEEEDESEDGDSSNRSAVADAVKKETADAYNKVGDTAATKGNVNKARAILTHLGYTDDEQAIIGDDDIFNYQGVGNPFRLANLTKGEKVLDLGSGLGIDSFLAAHYVGDTGRVVGVDIARKEVKHAASRASARGLSQTVSFVQGDIENLAGSCLNHHLGIDMDTHGGIFDVVISNGAFCLTPSKKKAFLNVFRALKPGGRFAICTTTVRKDLETEIRWPICMRMFASLNSLKPMCEEIGFKNVKIDLDDPDLEFELEGISEEDFNDPSGRSKVHVGSDEFKHLQDYNMNELCARVVVYGEK